jgi:hypothetical protein
MTEEDDTVSGEEEIRKADDESPPDAGHDEEGHEKKVCDLPESPTDTNPTSLIEQALEAYGIGK